MILLAARPFPKISEWRRWGIVLCEMAKTPCLAWAFTSLLQPASTVSAHSVSGLKVMHGAAKK